MINNERSIQFYDYLEAHFIWKKKQLIREKWIGMIHLTPNPPAHQQINNTNLFFKNNFFIESLKNCICLMTCSNYIKEFLETELKNRNYNTRVYSLYHPTELNNVKKFDIERYENNKNKSLIQIGRQLRKMSSIFLVNTSMNKIWLTGTKEVGKMKYMLKKECNVHKYKIDMSTVDMKFLKSETEYDDLLSENIVFIDLYDTGANNTVLECIARNTPIIINKTPGVIEYLGNDYPLYFNELSEVPTLIDRYKEGYNYLKTMDKGIFNIDHFIHKFQSIIYNEITTI